MSNIAYTRGDTYRIDGQVLDGDGVTPVNISGATITLTYKLRYSDTNLNAIFSLSTADDITITSAPLGTYTAEIKPSKTKDLAQDSLSGVYDIQIVLSNTKTYTLESGTLTLTPDVTRN